MTVSTSRPERADANRQAMLDAAGKLLAEQGREAICGSNRSPSPPASARAPACP